MSEDLAQLGERVRQLEIWVRALAGNVCPQRNDRFMAEIAMNLAATEQQP